MQKCYRTKISQTILDYVKSCEEKTFSAADIYAVLVEQEIKVNLATVYRNLDKLTEQQILNKFKASNSESYLYRLEGRNGTCHEHLHLQCKVCGKFYHLEGDFMKQIADYMKEQYGFTLECEKSSLVGICRECQEKQN